MPRLQRNESIIDDGMAATIWLEQSKLVIGKDREQWRWRALGALASLARTPAVHLTDLKTKAEALLTYQRVNGLLESQSEYHSLIRSLAQDVLARSA